MTLSTVGARALILSTAVAAVFGLAGCAGSTDASSSSSAAAGSTGSPTPSAVTPDEPSVGELYTKVRTSSLKAESGHVVGFVTDKGERLEIEIEGLADGSNQSVNVGIGKGTATILTVGGKNYLSGEKGFWTEQTKDPEAAKALVGKYVAVSAADAKELGDLNLGSLLKEMFADEELGKLERLTTGVETRSEGGQEVWVASDSSGSEFWVDPESENLVKIVVSGDDAGELTFDSWNGAATVKAPPAKKIATP